VCYRVVVGAVAGRKRPVTVNSYVLRVEGGG
jgi:hypothetical protein